MFLYHRVPDQMFGGVLYPLNQLRDRNLGLYDKYAEKYANRPAVSQNFIQQLDCLWGDVLFFSAVPPTTLQAVLYQAGVTNIVRARAYQVPVSALDTDRVIVLRPVFEGKVAQEHYVRFHAELLPEYARIPPAVIKYYKRCAYLQQRPFVFNGISQILYRGELDVSGLQIV